MMSSVTIRTYEGLADKISAPALMVWGDHDVNNLPQDGETSKERVEAVPPHNDKRMRALCPGRKAGRACPGNKRFPQVMLPHRSAHPVAYFSGLSPKSFIVARL